MVNPWFQAAKLVALAALVGLVAVHWVSVRDAFTLAVAAFYLLFVRVT